MRIAVDAFGGDNAPEEIIKGAIAAVKADSNLEIILCGNQEICEQMVKQQYLGDRISYVDAQSIITCSEDPIFAIRRKKDSSLYKMLELLKNGEADGGVSAGSTGAVLTGGIFVVGRIEGVSRPALTPELPTITDGTVVLSDCGANVDCTTEYLVQFAKLGAAYMQAVRGIDNPRIGLLNNGAESTKGSAVVKEAFKALSESNLNFVGNCESRYLLSGDFDVVVADGFDGNVALKSAEGTANVVFKLLKQEINSSFRAKLGALLLKPSLKRIMKKMDYTEHGGAAFVGLNKPLVKCHGASKAKSITAGILQCKKMIEGNIVGKIQEALKA